MNLKLPSNNDEAWVKPKKTTDRGPDYYTNCPVGGQQISFHKLFIKHGIAKCSCQYCDSKDSVAKALINARGGTFISIGDRTNNWKVTFICEHGKTHTRTFQNIKMGSWCDCTTQKKVKNNKTIEKPTCNCRELGISKARGPIHICSHYNFAVVFPEKAEEWMYDYNDVLPTDIGPRTHKRYWFKCKTCQEMYNQAPHIMRGCPYCAGKKVNEKNCLATVRPDLLEDWDYEANELENITPWNVTKNASIKINWKCSKCGRKWKVRSHKKANCKKCANIIIGSRKFKNNEYFLMRARDVHGDTYEYPNPYTGRKNIMSIICKNHGLFEQVVCTHLRGAGCPKCSFDCIISKGAKYIQSILDDAHVHYVQEKKFENLKVKQHLRFDFYIPSINLIIEYDGLQHFKPVKIWGGEEYFRKVQTYDSIKNEYCKQNDIGLVRIPYIMSEDGIDKVIEVTITKLMNEEIPYIVDLLQQSTN